MKSKETIKSIGYNQHEMLYNIMQLHNQGKPFDADITYSVGNFYGEFSITNGEGSTEQIVIPQPKHRYDVYPQVDGVEKIEPLGPIPLDDDSVDSVVCDLPFVISCGPSLACGKESSNKITRRFSYYYPVSQLLESYKHWLEECYRVLKKDGILVWKCQSVITGSKFMNTPHYSRLISEALGFDILDEFVLLAKQRLISGKVKNQQHARSFHSYFIVFKKSLSKKITYFEALEDDEIEKLLTDIKKNNVKRKKRGKKQDISC